MNISFHRITPQQSPSSLPLLGSGVVRLFLCLVGLAGLVLGVCATLGVIYELPVRLQDMGMVLSFVGLPLGAAYVYMTISRIDR